MAIMNDPASPRDWAGPRRFALLLAVMVFLPFWNVLLGFDTFVVRDWGLFSYPVATFVKECIWRGEWPMWNPYCLCGMPFLAEFLTLTLYPPSLIYLLLPLTWSLPAFCLLHVFWAGMGMYFLARRWTGSQAGAALAGVMFAFNGLSLNFLMWPSHIATYAWIPWVVFLAEAAASDGGKSIIVAGVAAAMQILGGGPETIAFTWLLAPVVAIAAAFGRQPRVLWPTVRRLAVAGALALGLAAAQLLPAIDLALHSHRDSHYAGSDWAMPLTGWANFLVPMFRTMPTQQMIVQPGQYWTTSYYAGIGVVFLAGMAVWRGRREWRVWLPAAFLTASLFLALGYEGYVFLWVRRIFPILGMFQFPVKFVILILTMAPLLAACGLAQIERRTFEGWRGWRLELGWGGVMLGLVGFIVWAGRRWPVPGGSWPLTAMNGLSRGLFLVLTLAALWLFARRPASRTWSIALLLAVGWLDILTHEPWQNPTAPPSVYEQGVAAVKLQLKPAPDIAESRIMISPFSARQLYYKPAMGLVTNFMVDRVVFLANCNLMDDMPKVDGFFPLDVREVDKVLWLLASRNAEELEKLEDFLSVSHTIAPGTVFDWVPRTHFIPIATIGQAPVFAEAPATYSAITDANTDFRKVVYLPMEAKATVKAAGEPRSRILAKDFANNRQSMDVETPAPTMLVLCQTYYHNWKATVDGANVPLWRANYAFQAVEVPAGRHRVVLTYSDNGFRVGEAVSLASVLACAAGWLALRRASA